MNLHRLLVARLEQDRPIRVGLIGVGKFASMFLNRARRTPGLQLAAVADLDRSRAASAFARTGWGEDVLIDQRPARSSEHSVWYTDDAEALIDWDELDVIVEATGSPRAGVRHALRSIRAGRHLVMVNVEADALVGPWLADQARATGVIYSLAYGDQPALICEHVDWARSIGLEVIAAGKGTKYLPDYHQSTPDTVWDHYGFTEEQVAQGDFNPRMFNSFLDGTKSAIEMAAVANATGLRPQPEGLNFPPAGANDLAQVCCPSADGGSLAHGGTVEVVSSLRRDGTEVAQDLRWGTYVTFAADDDYALQCFAEYGLTRPGAGRYAALYRPYHLIGLELGVSVASVALRGEATGSPIDFLGDVAATAKCDLNVGDLLDGEGGFSVYGRLMPAPQSLQLGCLPIGLAEGIRLCRPVRAGEPVLWRDVELAQDDALVLSRREAEAAQRAALGIAPEDLTNTGIPGDVVYTGS